jgi:NADPH:quinone reductase-like Zn-dependent oxidoreductase
MLQHALCYHHYGPPSSALTLRIFPLPRCWRREGAGQMRYAAINPSDLIPGDRRLSPPYPAPATAGYEGVGVVVDAPPAPAWCPVSGCCLCGSRTWQSHLDIDARWLVPVPDEIDDRLAARLY